MGNATWKGVRLKDVLAKAGLQASVRKVVFACRDDYRDSIALDRALQDGTILVYEMNGAPLTDKHGFPIRVIVPGIYGMKNAKWLERIEVVDGDFLGFWQKQGWSDTAGYQTMSRIDTPKGRGPAGRIPVQGVAFAGDRGISKVEVSVDNGATWREAQLLKPLGPFSWVRWSFDWTATVGAATLMVRAVDGRGAAQSPTAAEPFPDGATGYHTIRFRVDEA
jgi:DMSO/TMAO reductase YedYZ molybdopterin-dependent catalytic subunit